jgi:hypothetical protein
LTTKLSLDEVKRFFLSFYLIFHFSVIYCWMFSAHPWFYNYADFFRKYVVLLGLDQDYSVFAPTPRNENMHLLMIVTYKDGTTRTIAYPRIDRLPLIAGLWSERWRKFGHDNMAYSTEPTYLRDFARYVARENNDQDAPPVLVTLSRYSVPIPPPNEGMGHPLPPHFLQHTLITYEVLPKDLL